MKIRSGFVSNSSSTAFYFVCKEPGADQVLEKIEKYDQYFDLYYTNYNEELQHVDVGDVVKGLNNELNKVQDPDEWCGPKVTTVEELIEKENKHLEWIRKKMQENNFDGYYHGLLSESISHLGSLEDLQKAGFKHVLKVNFGDNDGPFSGTTLGYVMDYEGRNICINKLDFVVYTDQER